MLGVIAALSDYSQETKKLYKERIDTVRKGTLALHCRFFGNTTDRSLQWVRGFFLANNTEAFMFAA